MDGVRLNGEGGRIKEEVGNGVEGGGIDPERGNLRGLEGGGIEGAEIIQGDDGEGNPGGTYSLFAILSEKETGYGAASLRVGRMRGKWDKWLLASVGRGLDVFAQLIGWIFVFWLALQVIQ